MKSNIKTNKLDFKICLLGNYGTGKTSIMERKVKGTYNEYVESTIGAAFHTYRHTIDDMYMKIDVWDTAGSERYEALSPMYFRCTDTLLLVYDVNSNDCYNSIKKWINIVNKSGLVDNVPIIIIGNKIDLEETKESKILLDYVNKNIDKNILNHIYISCKTGQNIDELFSLIHNILYNTYKNKLVDTNSTIILNDNKDQSYYDYFNYCYC